MSSMTLKKDLKATVDVLTSSCNMVLHFIQENPGKLQPGESDLQVEKVQWKIFTGLIA